MKAKKVIGLVLAVCVMLQIGAFAVSAQEPVDGIKEIRTNKDVFVTGATNSYTRNVIYIYVNEGTEITGLSANIKESWIYECAIGEEEVVTLYAFDVTSPYYGNYGIDISFTADGISSTYHYDLVWADPTGADNNYPAGIVDVYSYYPFFTSGPIPGLGDFPNRLFIVTEPGVEMPTWGNWSYLELEDTFVNEDGNIVWVYPMWQRYTMSYFVIDYTYNGEDIQLKLDIPFLNFT